MSDISKQLREPFPRDDIEWRVQTAGVGKNKRPYAKVLAYITARAIQDRLDEVVGLENWTDEYAPGPMGGVLCKLSLCIDGKWITKQDVSDNTAREAVKGGVSGALKRAAVKFGIGRYLYGLTGDWAEVNTEGQFYQPKDKNNKYPAFMWDPPVLPTWALPGGSGKPSAAVRAEMQKVARELGDDSVEVVTAINNPQGKGIRRSKLVERIMVHVHKLPDVDQELWEGKIGDSTTNESLILLGLEVKAAAEKYSPVVY